MEKLLLREQEKFIAVQNASLGILVIDKSGVITLANNFLLALFGYANENELIGKKMEMLIPQRYHHQHVSDRKHFIAHPTTRPIGMAGIFLA